MAKYKLRKDKNHNVIRDELIRLDYSVYDAYRMGEGFPDLVAGKFQRNFLIEVKSLRGKLSPTQLEFFSEWHGEIEILRTVVEVQQFDERNRKRYGK